MNITKSTLNGNEAGLGGAVFVSSSHEVTFTHVTMADNRAEDGGGIYSDRIVNDGGVVNLHNSVVAGNFGGDCMVAVYENIGSWIGDDSCNAALEGDPLLGEWVAATEESTGYAPPLPNSPLIDSANRHYCSKADQIGTARPQGAGCDIGAIEFVGGLNSG